jgi:hypothetical protein
MSTHLRLRVGALAAVLTCMAVPAGLAIGQGIGPVEAVDDAAVALQDTTLNVAAPGVLGNDQVLASEPGAPSYTTCPGVPGTSATDTLDFRDLAPRVVTNAGQGTLTLQLDGSYTFVPAAGFVGTTTFPYSLANIDELPQCPINTRVNATLTIEVVATDDGSFDGTFTPVSAQTGPCILVDTTTIAFGDVPTGSTAWAAPSGGRTTTLSSCSPTDQAVNGTVSAALGGGAGAGVLSLEPTNNPVPSVSQFSYGLAARGATAPRPATPGQVLTTVPSGVSTLQGGSGAVTIEHYLIGPAAGASVSGTGFQFAVTLVATVRS